MPAVVGIDLAAGRGTTEVAVLTLEDESRRPVFAAASHRRVALDEDIIAAVAAAQPAVVAIDAPLSLPRAVMRGLPASQAPSEAHAATAGAVSSPYTRAAERDPIWSRLGIRPLPVSFLGGLTFRAISLLPQLVAVAPAAAIIEVFPTATLRCLGITRFAPGTPGKKAAKTTEASRVMVQTGLGEHIAGIAEPATELYGADLLDALAAAFTAVSYLQGLCLTVGDANEGTVVLPVENSRL